MVGYPQPRTIGNVYIATSSTVFIKWDRKQLFSLEVRGIIEGKGIPELAALAPGNTEMPC
jgi:hypothetical protein